MIGRWRVAPSHGTLPALGHWNAFMQVVTECGAGEYGSRDQRKGTEKAACRYTRAFHHRSGTIKNGIAGYRQSIARAIRLE